ncbi:MAG: serine/threonine-protein kinase [Anaerolineae bacterium]|nr:serine/threonine-protein kinase [Anaerolineae bacterium]
MNLTGLDIGVYKVRGLLGEGGMGSVYRAWDSSLEREVALKVLLPSLLTQEDSLARFEQEAKRAAQLEHKHIVPVYAYGTQEIHGQRISYIAMRLLKAGTLDSRKNGLSYAQTAKVFENLAEALAYAHQRGVIHLDIKPSNVMFDAQGEAGTPFLVDFGIAKFVDVNTYTNSTSLVLGTPYYMAPEQWSGRNVGPQSDQYALAVMAYQILAQRFPINGDTALQLMHNHIYTPATPIRTHRPDISATVEAVLLRALAKDAGDRYSSIGDFTGDLAHALRKMENEKTKVSQNTVILDNGRAQEPGVSDQQSTVVEPSKHPESARRKLSPRAIRIVAAALVVLALILGLTRIAATLFQVGRCLAINDDYGGGKIAFVQNHVITVFNANDSCMVSTIQHDSGWVDDCCVRDIAFSPDGTCIAYSATLWNVIDNVWTPETALFVANTDGSRKENLIDIIRNTRPDVSAGLLGSAISTATADIGIGESAWSPDGSKLAIGMVIDDSPQGSTSINDLFVINVDGSAWFRITNTPKVVEYDVSWLPDGSGIRFFDPSQDSYISTNLDGSNRQLVLDVDDKSLEGRLVWSPDGSRIAYTLRVSGNPDELYVMNNDGTNITQITNAEAYIWDFSWSPDSQYIVYAQRTNGIMVTTLYVINIEDIMSGNRFVSPAPVFLSIGDIHHIAWGN